MVSEGRHDRSAAKAQHPSPTSSASVPAVAQVAAGSSAVHQQETPAEKGSSGSEPALTQTTSHDAGRRQTEVRTLAVWTQRLFVAWWCSNSFVCVSCVNVCFAFVRTV